MAYVSIVEAVKLTGKSRSTISRYIKSGKLARSPEGIDTAELIRVFGELTQLEGSNDESQNNESMTQYETELLAYSESLEKEIKMLQSELKEQQLKHEQKEDRLLKIIENRLTDQRPTGFFKRLFG